MTINLRYLFWTMGFPLCILLARICSGTLLIYFEKHLIGVPLFVSYGLGALESLLISDVKKSMLSASALFEKGVELFKID